MVTHTDHFYMAELKTREARMLHQGTFEQFWPCGGCQEEEPAEQTQLAQILAVQICLTTGECAIDDDGVYTAEAGKLNPVWCSLTAVDNQL